MLALRVNYFNIPALTGYSHVAIEILREQTKKDFSFGVHI